jgi:hypothetical protein
MFAILIAAASLISQAYLFRNVDEWEINTDVTVTSGDHILRSAGAAADIWAGESDSSRTAAPARDR